MLTADRLRKIVTYEPETGLFRWRDTFAAGKHAARRNKIAEPGDVVAGSRNQKLGYIYISIDGSVCLAHRLAWLYVHGELPKKGMVIDHIDRDGFNNRLSNLRVCTESQNRCNSKMHSNNTSGHRGVSWHPQNREWRAAIWVNGRSFHSKTFKNIQDAIKWREEHAKQLHGEFASTAK